MLRGSRSLQHPWEGAKCCRPVSTGGEGGGLGGVGTGSRLRSLPGAGGCHTAAPSPPAASCAPEPPGAAPAQQRGCRRSWWRRREGWAGHALSQASRGEAGTAGYTGSKPMSLRLPNHWGFIPFKGAKDGCAWFAVQESKYPNTLQSVFPRLSRLHLWTLIYFILPFNTVRLAHPLMPASPNSQASSGWLVSERHFLAAAAFVGRCARRGLQQASRRFFVFWQTSLEDFAPTWARRGTGRCCASFPRSAGSAPPMRPATTAPPRPPLSFSSPLPAQASLYLEQRELSLPDCVVVFWCEQMGLGGQATSVRWILPPSQLFANGWELGEAGKLWVWAQNALFL